jgi:SRSO17 transposase
VYYPVHFEPYTPSHHFEKGKDDPGFPTKLKVARELVKQAVEVSITFRAVVADSFYGEDRRFKRALVKLEIGYVQGLMKSYCW